MTQLIEAQKLIVELYGRILRINRENARDIAADARRAEAFQYADALVALLDVKAAQILIALDRLADTGITQMSGAEIDPFRAKLRIGIQQRHEVAGKSCLAADDLGADDQFGGDLDHAKLLATGAVALVDNFVQRGRKRISAVGHGIAIVFLSRFQCLRILLYCAAAVFFHDGSPLENNCIWFRDLSITYSRKNASKRFWLSAFSEL